MNDYSEIEHGIRCLGSTYHHEEKKLKSALDKVHPDLSKRIEEVFPAIEAIVRSDLFLTCVSEHDEVEDAQGRLSMWRAYAPAEGVAVVLKRDPFFMESSNNAAYTTPVAYLHDQGFLRYFNDISTKIESSLPFLQSLPFDTVFFQILNTFRYAIVATKHVGFQEEREWRVVYMPRIQSSEHMRLSVEVINGVPQRVAKMQILKKSGSSAGFDINDLVDKIIIGPTAYPLAVSDAFETVLRDLSCRDVESKIITSFIPLRT